MKHAPKKLRPLCKWPGGKQYLARWIISLFPEHGVYVEPFAGGASVLLNKPRAKLEVLADTNAHLINLYRVVQDPIVFPAWCALVQNTPYCDGVFNLAKVMLPPVPSGLNPTNEALLFLIKHRFSRGGYGDDFAIGKRLRGKKRAGGPIPGDINAWETLRAHVPLLHERLVGVKCYHDRALNVIKQYAGPDTLFYLDPPYPEETRTVKDAYKEHELSLDDHKALLNAIVQTPAKGIFISTYPNTLYETILGGAGWDRTVKDMPNHAGQGEVKQRRQEVVWFRL